MSVKIKTPFDPERAKGIQRVTEVDHNAFGDVVVRQWTEYERMHDNNAAHHMQVLTFNDPEVLEIVRKADALALRNANPDTLVDKCPQIQGTWERCEDPKWSPQHAFCVRLRKGGPILFFDRGWMYTYETQTEHVAVFGDISRQSTPIPITQWYRMRLHSTMVNPNIKQEFTRDTIITDMAKLITRLSQEVDAKQPVPEDIVIEADRITGIIDELLKG